MNRTPPLATLVLFALGAGAAGAQTASTAADAKPYTLFYGDNISVGAGKDVYPVEDVSGSSWVVIENGQQTVISAKSAPINMKDTQSYKLTTVSATLAGLKSTYAYTFNNDPAVRLARSLADSAQVSAGAQSAIAQSQAKVASDAATSTSGGSRTPSTGKPNTGSAADVSTGPAGAEAIGAGSTFQMTGDQANAAGYDAIDVDFAVSSARSLATPYLVTFSWFRDAGTDPGMVKKLVFAKALDPIAAQPTNVHFQIGGFPIGFTMTNLEVHLYDHGQEIATNVAPKRVEMSREEAFGYVRTKYIESHKGFTLPAQPVMGNPPPDLRDHLAKGEYATPVYVKISKDGIAAEAYSDPACTKPIDDPYLETIVRSIRFKPALNQGVPVDSLGAIDVSKLRA